MNKYIASILNTDFNSLESEPLKSLPWVPVEQQMPEPSRSPMLVWDTFWEAPVLMRFNGINFKTMTGSKRTRTVSHWMSIRDIPGPQ